MTLLVMMLTLTAQTAWAQTTEVYVRISSLDQLTDGSKVIIAASYEEGNATAYYAMPNATSGRPAGELFESSVSGSTEILPSGITDDEDNYYWTVNVTNDGYTFTNANNDLLGYTSYTNFATGGNNTTWTIERATSEATAMVGGYTGFVVKNANNSDRGIAFNNTKFGAYETSNMVAYGYNFFLDFFVAVPASGTCGETGSDDVYWEYDVSGNTLIISGTGAMANYSDQGDQPWSSYRDVIEDIVIWYGVTSIGNHAFDGCSNVRTVNIPTSVTSIGDYAFYDCDGLESIIIPANVTSIGANAFEACTGLLSVSVLAPSCSLGAEAFKDCDYLTYIYVNRDKENDYKGATNWNVYSSKIKAHRNWTSGDCTVTLVGITLIVEKTDPSSAKGAMANYTDETEQPWKDCYENIETIVIEDGVTTIGNYAFYGCYLVYSVTIPTSVTSIGDYAFYDCDGLESIIIPANVTSIGANAFEACTGLLSVSVLAPSCSLGAEAFKDCDYLTYIYVNRDKENDYKGATNWNVYSSKIKAHPSWVSGDCTVTLAGGTTLIVEKTDPNSATGAMADYTEDTEQPWCGYQDDIEEIIIGDYVTHIGDYAFACFYNGNQPLSVTIPTSVTTIGANAFYNCGDLTSITIPASVESIGENAFNGCMGLTSITLEEGLTTINNYAFLNCSSLTSITIPSTVTTIGEGAFEQCSSLTSVTILASSCTLVGDAFGDCNKLAKIYVPSAQVGVYKAAENWEDYASIIEGLYYLTYDLAGGTLPAGKSNPTFYTGEDNNFLLNNPTKDGYAFVGWNYDRTEFGNTSNHTEVFVEVVPFWKQDYTFTATWIAEDATHKDLAKCRIEVDNPLYIGTGNYVGGYYDNGNGIKVYDGETLLTCYHYDSEKDEMVGDYSYSMLVSLDGGGCEDLGEHCRVLLSGEGNYVGGLSADVVIEPKTVTDASWGNLTWSLDGDGKFTITGTGAMDAAVDNSKYPWYKYCNNFTSITIGEGITSIAASAFAGTQNVHPYGGVDHITLPSSLTNIGANAFAFCTHSNLEIDVPTSVVSMGEGAFNSVASVTATLSDAVEDNTTFVRALAGATTSNVSFSRTFTSGVASTICLPFAVSSEKAAEAGTFYGFVGVNKTGTEWVVTMQEPSVSTLAANTPYLLKPRTSSPVNFSGDVESYSDLMTTANATDDNGDEVPGYQWQFKGTYQWITWNSDPGNIYGFAASAKNQGEGSANQDQVAAGEFVQAIAGASVRSFRAYLEYATTSTARSSEARTKGTGIETLPEYMTVRLIGKNGDVDAIGEISLSTGEVTFDSNAWYDLSGRRLAEKPTQRGIYINKGKKVALH